MRGGCVAACILDGSYSDVCFDPRSSRLPTRFKRSILPQHRGYTDQSLAWRGHPPDVLRVNERTLWQHSIGTRLRELRQSADEARVRSLHANHITITPASETTIAPAAVAAAVAGAVAAPVVALAASAVALAAST